MNENNRQKTLFGNRGGLQGIGSAEHLSLEVRFQ